MAGISASSSRKQEDYLEADCDKFTAVQITSEMRILLEWPMYMMGQN